jgi:type IX secretion system substrate protein
MKRFISNLMLFITTLCFLNINAQSFSSMYISSTSSQIGISGWQKVTGFTIGEKSSDWSMSASELTKSSGSAAALYFVSFSLSFSGSVVGNWGVGVSVNSSNPSSISATRYLANNDVGNVSGSGYITLNPNDAVSFRINPPSSANLTVTYGSFTIVRVEDIAAYNSYAEMGFNNNATAITIGTSFANLTNTSYTSSNSQNWSHTSGVLNAGAGSTGTYFVSASFSFAGSANNEFSFGVSKNNSDPVRIFGRRKISNGNDIGNIMIWGILSITEDVDNIRLKVKADASSKSLTVHHCHISLIKINGGTRDTDPFPYASMNISTSTPSAISLTSSTNNLITGCSNNITDNGYWLFNANQFSPIGISAGYYRVNYFVSYSTSAAADLTFKLLNNGTEKPQLTNRRKTSNTDRGSVGGNGIILISNSTDRLSLVANPTAGVNLSVYQSRLSLSRIEKTSDIPLPVEISIFNSSIVGNCIKLFWQTENEINNFGFEIFRSENSNKDFNWDNIGFVSGNGNSNYPIEYSFIDDQASSGIYYYRLKQIDNDGKFEFSKIIEVNFETIINFELAQNYPNPFNPTTSIKYQIPNDGNVSLKIYDDLGAEVRTLVNTTQVKGKYEVNFDASQLASGVYIYRIEINDFVSSKKMILLK